MDKQEKKRGYAHGTLPHRLLCGGGWRGVRCCMMGVTWLQGLYGLLVPGEVMRKA